MSRFLRILVAAVAAAVVAVALLAAAVAVLLKPADYAPVLARAVQAATGRPFELRGALHLRFFPCCGLAVDGAALGNPPGFPAGEFAEVEGADLGLRLWPLLARREVEVGRVTVRGLRVALVELADGRRNWDFGGGPDADGASPAAAGSGTAALRLAGLRVTGGRLDYRSERSGSAWRVEDLRLRTGEVHPGADFDVDLGGSVHDGHADRGADLHLTAAGTVAPDGQGLVLRAPKLTVAAHGAALPIRALQVTLAAKEFRVERSPGPAVVARELEGELTFDGLASPAADGTGTLVAHQLEWHGGAAPGLGMPELDAALALKGAGIPGRTVDAHLLLKDVVLAGEDYLGTARGEARLQGLGAQLDWRGAVRRDATGLGATGHLGLDPVSPRSVLAVLGRAAPSTADPTALTRLAGGAELELGPEAIALQTLDLTLDATRVTGRLRVLRDARHATSFDLRLDALDLDRYRSPKRPEGTREGAKPDDAPTDLPREGLRDREVVGTLVAQTVTLGGVKLGNVTATVRLADGTLHLDPLAAQLYGGTVRGSLAYDASGRVPRLTLDQQLAGVRIGELLRDGWQTDKLRGTLAASLAVRGEGAREATLLRSLGGSASARLVDGAWRGVDFWYEVRRARALLKAQEEPAKPAAPATPITRLDFAGKIVDGTWHSDTIAAEIPFVHLGGAGTLDLAGRQLDLGLSAQVTSTPTFDDGTTLNGVAGLTLPFTVAGPMSGPRLRVDAKALARGALGEKAKDVLRDKLRGLFNR